MTIDEMFNELENKARDIFIVTLKYKYDFEENYTIENQILDYNSIDDSYVWLNDWYEGQTDIEVLGYMILGDVDTTKLLTYEDCISRQMAIDAIKNIHPVDTEYHCTLYDEVDVMYVLKDLPAVTPIKENDLDEKMKEYKLGFQDGYVAGNKQSCEEREKGECPYYAG